MKRIPRRWLAAGVCVAVLAVIVAIATTHAFGKHARARARVASNAVSGRAAKAVGDSGVFATPIVSSNVRPEIAHADAESAAVAMSYRLAPSYQVVGVPYYKERPTERRHFCGRTYYVRPVVAQTDLAELATATDDPVMIWGPAWVIPTCNDTGFVQTTVLVADAPAQLRVLLGDQPGDVPEMVHPDSIVPRIVGWDAQHFPDWEHGIGMTPESAVAAAVARLTGSGARVTEVPEAFMLVLPQRERVEQAFIQTHVCARWRLTLDRDVELRGMTSGQVVRTRTVFVMAGENGCGGAATVQIPLPAQPPTLPFLYGLRPTSARRGEVVPPEMRSTALKVTEPIWFEEARVRR